MPEQLPLFAPSETPGPVGTARHDETIAGLATRLPKGVFLGTCSWSFPGWKDLVYDRSASKTTLARHGLAAYARHPMLGAVCLDRTYYAPITKEAYAAYAAQVPAEFRFVVKAHELVTRADSPHYLDLDYAEREVVRPCLEGLGDKAAVLLFQFPPQSAAKVGGAECFADELHRFLTGLPSGPTYAVELRTAPLLTGRYVEALSAARAAHAYNVHPTMPSVAEQAERADASLFPVLVVRWMLRRDRAYEEALEQFEPFNRLVAGDAPSRTAIAALCRGAAGRGQTAFVVVNNKAEGSAPLSLAALAEMLAT